MWEVSWRLNKDCNILTPPTLLAITAFLSRSPGLLNRGPGSLGAQPLLGHGSHSSIFSPTDLNFLSPGLYNNLTSTYFLRASQFALNSTPWQSMSPPDIFDRMHLLFTQVHFVFWQLGQVRGQYATQYWTSPGGSTLQSSGSRVTYYPWRKLSKLDEPDMRDTAGEVETSS